MTISATQALPTAAMWLAELMTGSAATSTAVLAVAGLGLLMLYGRLPMRQAGRAVFGCFVLFTAQGIASALLGLAGHPQDPKTAGLATAPLIYRPTRPAPVPYDPYAGASVPQRAPVEAPIR